jgi:hypothetical protein
MGEILDLVLLTVSTCLFYFLSNFHTYNIGIKEGFQSPLKDALHDMLPDLSKYVYLRDVVLPLFIVPLFFVYKNGTFVQYVYEFWESFMFIVMLKAITIFFTFLPASNPECARKKQVNHCFHQIFSGHNSFVLLLCLLYLKYLAWSEYHFILIAVIVCTILYSFFILMTRAHYSVDILISYIIVFLMYAQ